MKHYILLSVEIPPGDPDDMRRQLAHGNFATLRKHIEPIAKKTKGVLQLAANVWLIERASGMPFVAECMTKAQSNNLTPTVKFLSEDD